MASYLKRMPSGVVGSITRPFETNVETAFMNSGTPVLSFGAPVKMASGKIVPFAGGETTADFFGVITRVAPSISGSTAQTFANAVPNPEQLQGVAVRGYVNVVCTVGTPARNGTVYVRIVAATGKAIGDFEATADGANNIAITGVTWNVDGKDASNIAEIRIAK